LRDYYQEVNFLSLITLPAADECFWYRGKIFAYLLKTIDMQNKNFWLPLIAVMLVSLSSCEVIGDIFQAGVWTGLILVAVVIAIVIWLISRFRK
jgi:hypothetical protein